MALPEMPIPGQLGGMVDYFLRLGFFLEIFFGMGGICSAGNALKIRTNVRYNLFVDKKTLLLRAGNFLDKKVFGLVRLGLLFYPFFVVNLYLPIRIDFYCV